MAFKKIQMKTCAFNGSLSKKGSRPLRYSVVHFLR